MEESKKNQKKLSYEELNELANQLGQQNRQLSDMIRQANMTNMFKRLDYLFKVLERKECFKSDFVIACAEEIENIISIPEEPEDQNKEA